MSDVGVEVYESVYTPSDLDDDFDVDFETPRKAPTKPYDPLDEIGVDRDQWGRPLILPDPAWQLDPARWPDGKVLKRQRADGRRAFARVSTACGWNDVGYGLALWKQRMTLLALARRPDLQAMLAAMTYADGKAIDDVAAELLIRAADDGIDVDGELSAARRGSAWHAMTVPGAPVIDPVFGPTLAQYAVTARAFGEALDRCGLELIEHERFGVDHEHTLAGTVDHIAVVTRATPMSRYAGLDVGEAVCVDKKTGKLQWITHITQLAMYARCAPTNWQTGECGVWHERHNPDVGIVAAASLVTGQVKLYPVATPGYLVTSAVQRYRNSLAEHVDSLTGKGF